MRFLYLNTQNIYPHDKHLIYGLRELGHEVREIDEQGGLRGAIKLIKRLPKESVAMDAIIVGFTQPLFAIAAGLSSRKKVIFNATSSQYEANTVSRSEYGFLGLRAIKWWLIDFLSFHLSSVILLESYSQIEYTRRLFFVPRTKMVRSLSGVDEKEFFYDPTVNKKSRFTVLFRGRFLPESGILTVIEAAKKLEGTGVDFLVIGHGFMYREVNALVEELAPKNLTMINEKLPMDTLRKIMLECHISLGQLADHPRLDRTLPCKLFETLAMGLPYVTGRNKAAMEVLKEGETCIAVNPGDARDLAEKLAALERDRETVDRIGKAGYELHKKHLTSAILTKGVIEACFKIK